MAPKISKSKPVDVRVGTGETVTVTTTIEGGAATYVEKLALGEGNSEPKPEQDAPGIYDDAMAARREAYIDDLKSHEEPELIGSFSASPIEISEAEAEALRQRLRDSVNPPTQEIVGTGTGETGFQKVQLPSGPAIDSALGQAGLGLHHGYPPHSPGSGIQSELTGSAGPSEGLVRAFANGAVVEPKPTVGRIVHFYSDEKKGPHAAIITGVHDDDTVLDLHVFLRLEEPRTAARVSKGLPNGKGRRWFWPARD